MERYKYNGKTITHRNLSAFLLDLGMKGYIPYSEYDEEQKKNKI